MDWPFIENSNNLIVDYHIVYATVMVYLGRDARRATCSASTPWSRNCRIRPASIPALKPLVA